MHYCLVDIKLIELDEVVEIQIKLNEARLNSKLTEDVDVGSEVLDKLRVFDGVEAIEPKIIKQVNDWANKRASDRVCTRHTAERTYNLAYLH